MEALFTAFTGSPTETPWRFSKTPARFGQNIVAFRSKCHGLSYIACLFKKMHGLASKVHTGEGSEGECDASLHTYRLSFNKLCIGDGSECKKWKNSNFMSIQGILSHFLFLI